MLSAAILCFLACSVYFIHTFLRSDGLDDIRSQVSTGSSNSSSASSKTSYVETPVNFVELKKINPDVYAWINIPGTSVDYPILRREDDNAYYLNHTVENKRSDYGSIYTENYNDKNFDDFNTVVYGHNMLNGSMFGSLRRYRNNRDYAKTNNVINVYLHGRILKYQIFATYITDDRHLLLNNDFKDRAVCEEYLKSVFAVKTANSFINTDLVVDADDKIITLSTCVGNDDKRFLVQGVLTYDSREQ